MQTEQVLSFGAHRLAPRTGQLWRGKQAVKVTPKVAALLCYLVERAGQVVTKEELLTAVWPETVVSEAALTSCMQALRQALRDKAKRPRLIATVHRRGYQFIGTVSQQPSAVSSQQDGGGVRALTLNPEPLPLPIVGREAEVAQLQGYLEKALRGERQIIFVTGEPGIGKTTVVEAFLGQLEGDDQVRIGRGQCIEHYGAGEAYLPVLEALGRLCREAEGEEVIALLRQQAPTWLVQLPAVLREPEREKLQQQVMGAPKERMLRELAEAVEVMTRERGLILRFEDLQWSDVSTLDWLAYVARRHERARLLILGTYRPVAVLTREHPLKGVKQELQPHGQCAELALDFLTEATVSDYLAVRFQGSQLAGKLARPIHQRTDGNPLFMINTVDYLVQQGVVVQADDGWELKSEIEEMTRGVPQSVRQLIERQIERLSVEAQQVLEVASVAGAEFSAAAIAAGLDTDVVQVETQCEEVARQGHLIGPGGFEEWPDGTIASRYRFVHALYRDVLYERVAAARRVQVHKRIGEREEAGYADRVREIAAELAVHFERGRDYPRAIQYLRQATENALEKSANVEAVGHLTKGLELLKRLPDTPERLQQELTLQTILGPALMTIKGYAAPEVEKVCSRMRKLCRQLGETPQLHWVLPPLRGFHFVRGELGPARELADQCLTLAQREHSPVPLIRARYGLGETLLFSGEFISARLHLEQGIATYDPQQIHTFFVRTVQDPGVACLTHAALTLWLLGYPAQALKRIHEAFTLAQELSHPFSQAWILHWAAVVHLLRRDGHAGQEREEALIALSREQGFPLWEARGTILRGRILTEQGQREAGLTLIGQGLAAYQATGAKLIQPYYLALLAESYGKVGRTKAGLTKLTEALTAVRNSGERIWEAELYRLKGKSLLQNAESNPQAEECFHKALAIARHQQAKSWELRAALSLARLWQQQRKKKKAYKLLSDIYNWFTEGFDTADLKEAKTLLEELAVQ